jgi:hypothetical protein
MAHERDLHGSVHVSNHSLLADLAEAAHSFVLTDAEGTNKTNQLMNAGEGLAVPPPNSPHLYQPADTSSKGEQLFLSCEDRRCPHILRF